MNEVEYVESLLGQIDRLNEDLLKVKRSNSKLKGENRHLQRIIRKKNEELEKVRKPPLRKGRKRSRHGRI